MTVNQELIINVLENIRDSIILSTETSSSDLVAGINGADFQFTGTTNGLLLIFSDFFSTSASLPDTAIQALAANKGVRTLAIGLDTINVPIYEAAALFDAANEFDENQPTEVVDEIEPEIDQVCQMTRLDMMSLASIFKRPEFMTMAIARNPSAGVSESHQTYWLVDIRAMRTYLYSYIFARKQLLVDCLA